MSAISTSEKKRLESLKEKKQAFKARGQIIRQALANLDNATNKNRIIFDDDFGEKQDLKLEEKKKRDLFDNAEDNEEALWNEDEFSVKKHKKITLGNDERFTLVESFTQDDHEVEETEVIEDTNEYNLQKEKEKELEILETVLGVPLKMKNQETKVDKKGLMIRYDPTENGHCKYEIKYTQVEETEEKKIKKNKRDKSKIEEFAPVEVSKDIYYSVSDTLTQSLKQEGGFSLLKAFGRDRIDDMDVKDCNAFTVESQKKNNRLNFNTKDMFKHDSSDNEATEETFDTNEKIDNKAEYNSNIINDLIQYKDTLFFDSNDIRFNEAVKFFSADVISNDNFKKLRRELKMIVRKKIRQNIKRHEPWGKKKIKRS